MSIKLKNKKYNTVGTVHKSNCKIAETVEQLKTLKHIHDRSFSWFDTGISIKNGGFKIG
jgi:hypothetical protein